MDSKPIRQSAGGSKTRSTPNKLVKRRGPKRFSMEIPARFQEDEDDDDEAMRNSPGSGLADELPNMAQQSFYGMIAAAQTNEQFNQVLEDVGSASASDSEEDHDDNSRRSREASRPASGTASPDPGFRHRKNKLSETRLLRSFLKTSKDKKESQKKSPDLMTQSQILPPRDSNTTAVDRQASAVGAGSDRRVLDRKLQAQAKAELESSSISQRTRKDREGGLRQSSTSLPLALANIFQFDQPEELISEFPCWYLQSVLLQGYMYVTQKHVCFYAYLPKKSNIIVKSGHLAKQGKRNPRYRRYWFTLKGDIFSYFPSAAEPHFPSGMVDLRRGISSEMVSEKGKEKDDDATTFTITTDERVYHFKADSNASAKEWVKQLQKVIFRAHNDGDSVKISLPIANIVDVESNPVIEVAETIKLRVIDNDETYAVEEYFFTFFSSGKEALNVLKVLTDGNDAKRAALEGREIESEKAIEKIKTPPRRSLQIDQQALSPLGPDHIRSTLSPLSAVGRSSPRASSELRSPSGDFSRSSMDRSHSSFDRGRRSVSATSRKSVDQTRQFSKSPLSPYAPDSSESFATSSEQTSDSPSCRTEREDDMSASQMLSGDRAFRAPTIRMPQPRRTFSGSTVERIRRESQESSRSSSPRTDRVRVQPPSQQQTEQNQDKNQSSESASRPLRSALATPLHHAFTFAGHFRSQSKRVGSYLGSSPKDYYAKFSDAFIGGKRHYSEADGLAPEDRIKDAEDDLDAAEHERRFQQHFGLPETERLVAVFYCSLHRVLPLYGKIYVGLRRFCFRSLIYGTRTKLNVPFRDIDNIEKEKGFRWGYPGMVVVIRGHEEIFFDFASHELRDDCVVTVLRGLNTVQSIQSSTVITQEEQLDADEAAAENRLLQDARKDDLVKNDSDLAQTVDSGDASAPPVLFDDTSVSVLDFKPKEALRITCLTIGSRGDVQPYVALCKGLIADGHKARIATHRKFKDFVEANGVEFAPVDGDPEDLMKICVDYGMFTPSFLLEANSKFRGWLGDLLTSAYDSCKNSDLLIESPSAMCGIHIAEALAIPYFRAFTMPWTRTRAYPHAFAVPTRKMGGQYNYMTYLMFDSVFWNMTRTQINRWRGKTLGLKPTTLEKMQPNKVPFLYNFSPSVVMPPLDFSDWVRVTGYWLLDEDKTYEPPADLVAFIKKARDDGQKLVYIGFGSVTVKDSQSLTENIIGAVLKADVRCIFSKGWSDHFENKDGTVKREIQMPPSMFQVRSVPHDWLFPQIDAAVHHGGAGTTGASLRCGLPTIIKPFFGDQFFFATRVEDLGVGIYLKAISVNNMGKAIWVATHDERMQKKAKILGEKIRSEDGVSNAINAIYRDLDYARTLIKKREYSSRSGGKDEDGEEDEDDAEESWTFVEGESDVDVTGQRYGHDTTGFAFDEEMMRPKGGESRKHARHVSLGSMVLRSRGA